MATKAIFDATLLVELDHGVNRSVEFVFTFEESDFGDENISEQLATLL
jgi:hypothetical protein